MSSAGLSLLIEAVVAALVRQGRTEWFGSPPHLLSISWPRARGFAAFPADSRPGRPEIGRAIMVGAWVLAGTSMTIPPGGDPFDRPSPSRPFADALHRFGWLRHLLAVGEPGAREALRLISDWRRAFGRWSSFAWSGETLERRTVNLACAAGALAEIASDAEVEALAELLARQARQLLVCKDPAWRAAERAVAAGLAASALAGAAGDRLLARSLSRIDRLLPRAVLPDGGHVSRSPEAGLELLLDLLALDDGWAQRGFESPAEASRAIDRLTAALRFFTLPDGRLACFQGGEEGDPVHVAAARARDETPAAAPPVHAPHAGYHRLAGRSIQVMVDAAPPAPAPFSASACAQPAAIEIVCGRDRLITNAGWSLKAPSAQALRLSSAGSTAALDHASAGRPLAGWRARALGPRLIGGAASVQARRAASDSGLWLDLVHDGWSRSTGLLHERRLYLDFAADELRGEDQFTSAAPGGRTRVVPYSIHFQLAPEVEAVVARDRRSVLLRGPSEQGWWLRNDAVDVRVEPAVHFRDGRQLATHQIVLMGHVRADKGGRVRWKLTKIEG